MFIYHAVTAFSFMFYVVLVTLLIPMRSSDILLKSILLLHWILSHDWPISAKVTNQKWVKSRNPFY